MKAAIMAFTVAIVQGTELATQNPDCAASPVTVLKMRLTLRPFTEGTNTPTLHRL
jgi:hypothetical protein